MFEWSHIGQWLCSIIDEVNGEKILAQMKTNFANVIVEAQPSIVDFKNPIN